MNVKQGFLGFLVFLFFPHLNGEEAPKLTSFKKISENEYELNQIILNQETREIRFPALVNMSEGLLEFLIVHEHGAVHESLFRTSVSPLDLNLALTLLKYQPSKELYTVAENGSVSSEIFTPTEEQKKASRVRIEVEWESEGNRISIPVESWVIHDHAQKSMSSPEWVYGGSDFYEGRFIPERTGEIVAIYTKDSCLINYAGVDRDDDTVWKVNSKKVPPIDTKLTLKIFPLNIP